MNKYYLKEFKHHDGVNDITMNIVDITTEDEITIAITKEGRISVVSFDLKSDDNGLFFEYGLFRDKIAVKDFEKIEESSA